MTRRHVTRRGFILLPVSMLLALIAAMAFIGQRESTLIRSAGYTAEGLDKARYAAEAGLQRVTAKLHSSGCGVGYPSFFSPVKDTSFDGASYSAYVTQSGTTTPVNVVSVGKYGDTSINLLRKNVPVHDKTPYTITLQPGPEGFDTFIKDDSNRATEGDLEVDKGNARGLIRFDLSKVPAGAHVTSATLSMYAVSGDSTDTVSLYRMLRDWTVNATWSTYNGTRAWQQSGGDFMPTSVATSTFTTKNTWLTWNVTGLVDRWVKGSVTNQGLLIQTSAVKSGLKLASGDKKTTSIRPKLTVTFLPPCDWVSLDTVVTLPVVADATADFLQPVVNFGTATTTSLNNVLGVEQRSLLRFDLSSIAAGKTVSNATLRVYMGALGAGSQTSNAINLEAHAVTQTWSETAVTWLNSISGSLWLLAGSDYTATPDASIQLPANTAPGIWLEFPVTARVQQWISGTATNNGFVLLSPDVTMSDRLILNSKEASANPPELVVTYQ